MSTTSPFSPRRLTLFMAMALAPAVIALSSYAIFKSRHSAELDRRLTPQCIQLLKSAQTVSAYRLVPDPASTATQHLLGYSVEQRGPTLDDYFVMRLRKALLANGNTSDARSPCAGDPTLAYQLSDDKTTCTVLLNLVCRTLRTVVTDLSGKAIAEGRSTLTVIGADQFRFLEAEAFQPH